MELQHDLQEHKLMAPSLNVPVPSGSEPVMENVVPVEDAVEQLQLQLKMVQSHIRYDSASVPGRFFVDNCSLEYW
jgi:hypothetical protein